jgi:hypothetical protein
MYTFVLCPQFFCLFKPIAHVCTPRSLDFPSHTNHHWPICIKLYVLLYLPQPTFLYTGHYSKTCCSYRKNSALLSTSPELLTMLRDIGPGADGSCLSFQLLKRQRPEGSQFEASPRQIVCLSLFF